jgi:hypothetical protein
MTAIPPVDLATSVAGEEDPGASNEVGSAVERPKNRPMASGDEAPAGTPGTGEKTCPDCGGSGQRAGRACPTCGGTGKINAAVGGG